MVVVVAAVVASIVAVSGSGAAQSSSPVAHVAEITPHTTVLKSSVKAAYVGGSTTVPGGQTVEAPFHCPKKYSHPISGFFHASSSQVFMSDNGPESPNAGSNHVWIVRLSNTGPQAAEVDAGVVCTQ